MQYDSFDDFDKDVEEENAKNSRLQKLFILSKDGDAVTFRILSEALPFIAIKEHTNYEKTVPEKCFQAMCGSMFGKPCHYCAQYEKTGDKAFKVWTAIVYPIWIQDWINPRADAARQSYMQSQINEQKLWIIKCHKKQEHHHDVREFYTRHGSILSAEWMLSRRGDGLNTTYKLAVYPSNAGALPLVTKAEVDERLLSAIPPVFVEDATDDAA